MAFRHSGVCCAHRSQLNKIISKQNLIIKMKFCLLVLLLLAAILLVSVNSQENSGSTSSRRRSRIFRNYWNRRSNSTTTPSPSTTDADAEEVTEPTPSSELSNKHGEVELIDSCNREPGCVWQCKGNSRGGETPAVCSCVCKTAGRSNHRTNSRPQNLRSRTN